MKKKNKSEVVFLSVSDISFNDIGNPQIPENARVRVTFMNHLIEVQYMEKMSTQSPIIKLSKDEYICRFGDEAGVIKEFQHIENRMGSFSSIKQSFKKMRYLINNNFTGGKNELFITLTYAENMQDTKRLYQDFKKFVMRMKYHYDKENVTFEYFSVVEPQGRGAWHIHALFKFNVEMYIDNAFLREMWGNGFVNIHRIKDVDNIGAYLTAYLADFEVKENSEGVVTSDMQDIMLALSVRGGLVEKEVDENGVKKKKKIIKGGRLIFYPSGLNLFRKSKGITYPERKDLFYDELKKGVVSSAKPTYTKGMELLKHSDESQSNEHFNSIIYEHYNLKRI